MHFFSEKVRNSFRLKAEHHARKVWRMQAPKLEGSAENDPFRPPEPKECILRKVLEIIPNLAPRSVMAG
ncbi:MULTISPECIES: hypothetical protein [unclassified Rhizobium]|uniref:hypothetical protein n=1 Tax=unclassified Rhizobium TaxID=2613769 RepID=UPI000A5B6770|nr:MULTISPECIES: hypothetical protein [unclassified Rhizobium]